jgi:acyl carrier protein
MSTANIQRLQQIFREVFDDSSLVISPAFSPADHSAWDSIAMVQIVLATEQEFGVRFPMETVAEIKSVEHILRALPQ